MNDQWLIANLEQLSAQGLKRQLRTVSSSQGRSIIIDGKKVLNFCSNNYLGLADDPRLVDAAVKSLVKFGLGSGASRLVCGNMVPHEELESTLAELKSTESALLFNSGYAANCGVIPALFNRDDIVFCDKLNHASIIDGIILSRAELKRYPHLDMQALEQGLKDSAGHKRRVIVTDSVFSMDGDVAPLQTIVDLAKRYQAYVMVDEAHGFGVLGEHGGGLAEELGVSGQIDIQMGTLSKAAGCFGAYVCGRKNLREYLINHARSFIYTTALPASLAAAAQAAVGIIQSPEGQALRKQLKDKAAFVRGRLKQKGFDTLNSSTPIIPVVVKDAAKAVAATKCLLEQGMFVQAIRPPTVAVNTARLRITVMATHTQEDLDRLLSAMDKI